MLDTEGKAALAQPLSYLVFGSLAVHIYMTVFIPCFRGGDLGGVGAGCGSGFG